MLLNKHIQTQLEKARKSFFANSRIFYSDYLFPKIKIICYMLLIRPILTYGCPIWYNISPHTMEKIRIFERKCLRACTRIYKSERSNFLHYENCKILYDKSNIPRIDSHIIKLIRDYFANINLIKNNNLINSSLYPNDEYYKRTFITGNIPPEAFPLLDRTGRISDRNNIPIIYHNFRKTNDKKNLV